MADLVKEKEEAEKEGLDLKKRVDKLENDLRAARTHADQEVARTASVKKELEVRGGWVGGWVSGWMGGLVSGWAGWWVSGWVGDWVCG